MPSREACRTLLTELDAATGVRRALGRALPQGTLPPGIAALATLDRCGQLRAGQLADELHVDMSVASRHIAHLVADGLLERGPNPADGRSCLLNVTPAGRGALDGVVDACVHLLTDALADWEQDDVRQLGQLLGRLRESVYAVTDGEPVPVAGV